MGRHADTVTQIFAHPRRVKTVATHRQHIKQKLKLRTGPELIRLAVRWAAAQQLV